MKYDILLVRLPINRTGDLFPTENRPPFDLMQTSEILKVKHHVLSLIIDLQIQPLGIAELAKKCLCHSPKVIVLSCISAKIFEFRNFFRIIKQQNPNIICIAVGHLATYYTLNLEKSIFIIKFLLRIFENSSALKRN